MGGVGGGVLPDRKVAEPRQNQAVARRKQRTEHRVRRCDPRGEEQAALRECATVGRDVERSVIADLNKQSLEKIKAAGLEVNALSDEEQARIREKSMVVYEKHKEAIGTDVVDSIMAQLAEIRK